MLIYKIYNKILPPEKAAYFVDSINGADLLIKIELESPHNVRPDVIKFELLKNDLI